jgi:hypothetical protein
MNNTTETIIKMGVAAVGAAGLAYGAVYGVSAYMRLPNELARANERDQLADDMGRYNNPMEDAWNGNLIRFNPSLFQSEIAREVQGKYGVPNRNVAANWKITRQRVIRHIELTRPDLREAHYVYHVAKITALVFVPCSAEREAVELLQHESLLSKVSRWWSGRITASEILSADDLQDRCEWYDRNRPDQI